MDANDVAQLLLQRCELDDLVGNPWPHDDPALRLRALDVIGKQDLPGWTQREVAATLHLHLAEEKADYMAAYWSAEWSGVHNLAKERGEKMAAQNKQKAKQDAVNRLYDDIFGPAPAYRSKTFDKFVPRTEVAKDRFGEISDWPCKYPSRQIDEEICWFDGSSYYLNLILAGPPGTGKTHLACAVYLERRGEWFYGAEFIRSETLIRKFREKEQKESALFRRYGEGVADPKEKMDRGCELLVIDDVGVDTSDYARQILIEIIDRRNAAELFTVMTTNLTKPELIDMFGDRGASRLFYRCRSIAMTGSDYREVQPNPDARDGGQ